MSTENQFDSVIIEHLLTLCDNNAFAYQCKQDELLEFKDQIDQLLED
jgi:hypothetical protein